MSGTFEFQQRKYDGKWVLFRYMIDPSVDLEDYEDKEMLIPKIWIPIGVYDYMIEVAS